MNRKPDNTRHKDKYIWLGCVQPGGDMGIFLLMIMICWLTLWLVNAMVPVDPHIRNTMRIIALGAIVMWLLDVFNIFRG